MLWAPGSKDLVQLQLESANAKDYELDLEADQSVNEMDLVEIRSHTSGERHRYRDSAKSSVNKTDEETKEPVVREDVKGFALIVKETYSENILDICQKVRPLTFLSGLKLSDDSQEERPLFCAGSESELVIIVDESALISAIDQK